MRLTEEQRAWLGRAQREWAEVMRPGAERMGAHLFALQNPVSKWGATCGISCTSSSWRSCIHST